MIPTSISFFSNTLLFHDSSDKIGKKKFGFFVLCVTIILVLSVFVDFF